MQMINLTEKVKALAEARKCLVALDDELVDLGTERDRLWRAEHPDLFEKQTSISEFMVVARDSLAAIEAEVRADACAAFEQDGDKNPAPGVSVVISTSYDYPPDEALKWAMNHDTALSLDKKAFGEVCKSDRLRPDFVNVVQEPSARIAADLKKSLEVK
jgi:hypothetical protein